jgi:N-methylhydantoinase A
MMTAGGGMTTIETAARIPIRLVESGPAGGAILAAKIARDRRRGGQVLSFDMGGTTAKLCLIDDARPQTARRFEIARAERFLKGSGMPVRIPVIEMIEIGAGGGSWSASTAWAASTRGPRKRGRPTPVRSPSARAGYRPTVTDADVTLGYIDPDRLPRGDCSIDTAPAAEAALVKGAGACAQLDGPAAAFGVSDIVDEAMASAGRMHAVESGKDLGHADHDRLRRQRPAPRHARGPPRAGVRRILIPRDPGVGSAVGFLHAAVSFEIVRSRYATLEALDIRGAQRVPRPNGRASHGHRARSARPTGALTERRTAFMRYHGQGHEIEIPLPARDLTDTDLPTLRDAFEAEYTRQFSRPVPDMVIEVLNWGVSVASPPQSPDPVPATVAHRAAPAVGQRHITCDLTGAPVQAAVHDRALLSPGDTITGPALIVEPQTTTLLSADFTASIDAGGHIVMERRA